jgi:hypothetical protein
MQSAETVLDIIRPEVITGEQGAGKLASPVREGADGAGPRRVPRRRPTSRQRGVDGETGRRYRALSLPTWYTSARRAPKAAQRREKALSVSESRSSNLRGYNDPVRSAKFPTGVNKIMTLLNTLKTRAKAVLLIIFEGQRDWGHFHGGAHFHGVED